MSIVRLCLCLTISMMACLDAQSFDGSIDCLMLEDISVAPPTGPGGALLAPTLDGGYSRKGEQYRIVFPPHQDYFGHNAVRIRDILPFFGYRSTSGYYKVVGPSEFPPGFQIKAIKTPKGFPNVDEKKNIVWIDGWRLVAARGVLSLKSNKDSDRISFKLQLRHPNDIVTVLAQGDLEEGSVFDVGDQTLRITKVHRGDPKRRRIGFIEYSVER